MDPAFSWTLMCSSVQSHAANAASQCSAEAAGVILAETKKFCDQAAPVSAEDHKARQIQHGVLINIKIGNMVHADAYVKSHPAVARLIMDAARDLCERPLPKNQSESDMLYIQSGTLVGLKIPNFVCAATKAESHPVVAGQILDAVGPIRDLKLPISMDEAKAQQKVAAEFIANVSRIVYSDTQRQFQESLQAQIRGVR
jgi:hypothetical protein